MFTGLFFIAVCPVFANTSLLPPLYFPGKNLKWILHIGTFSFFNLATFQVHVIDLELNKLLTAYFFLSFFVTVKLKKNKSKSDKSKSAWHSRKYVTTELNFFHTQFEVPRVKSRQLYYKKIPWKALSFYIYFGCFVRIWNFKWL